MKKTFLLIFIILCSCDNKEIDGTWIGAYKLIKLEDKQSYENLNTIIKIEDNRFYNQVLGLEKGRKLFSFEFTKSGNSIISEDKTHMGFNIESLSKDSLVLSVPQMEEIKLVYRKLHEKSNKTIWNPTGKSYRFEGKKSGAYSEYINDSTMIEYDIDHENVSVNQWWLEDYESYTFLLIKYPISTFPLLIDSTTSKNVYLTSLDDKIRNYEYKHQNKPKSLEILGTWNLMDKKNDAFPSSFDPYLQNKMQQLDISEESFKITLGDSQTVKKYSWSTSVTNKLIFLIGKEYKVLKIVSINDNEMVLEIELEPNEKRKRLLYRRE